MSTKVSSMYAHIDPTRTWSEFKKQYYNFNERLLSMTDSGDEQPDIICIQGIHGLRVSRECASSFSQIYNVLNSIEASMDVYDLHIEKLYDSLQGSKTDVLKQSAWFDCKKCIEQKANQLGYIYAYYTNAPLMILSKKYGQCDFFDEGLQSLLFTIHPSKSYLFPMTIMNTFIPNISAYQNRTIQLLGGCNDMTHDMCDHISKCIEKFKYDIVLHCSMFEYMKYQSMTHMCSRSGFRFTNPHPFDNRNYILWKGVRCVKYSKFENGGVQICI